MVEINLVLSGNPLRLRQRELGQLPVNLYVYRSVMQRQST